MPADRKVDPFKPQQPQIPGVPAKPMAGEGAPHSAKGTQPATGRSRSFAPWPPSLWPAWLRIGLAAAVVIVIVALAWRAHVSSATPSGPPVSAAVAVAPPVAVKPVKTLPIGPGEIATAGELAKPWSSKEFLFRSPVTSELIPALAVRLPGGALWGISLREPYGNCQLDYVTDLSVLRSQFDFRAVHPMVVNSCSGSIYDLARYTGGPNGLVRGQVVRGTALRAPLAIEVFQRGNSIIVGRMEGLPAGR
jgi:hypothetical protein